MKPYWIFERSPPDAFPDVDLALREPNGLLAVGGDLSPARLLCAYARGIFPWYSDDQPVLWWSPDPRTVILPERLHVSRSLRKKLRRGVFEVSRDRAFEAVIDGCAAEREQQSGTWITPAMRAAYLRLHELGYAHSIECWHDGQLAGGLYGVALGRVFFGESMFSRKSDASKVALAHLCQMDFEMVDCQLPNAHLERLGAVEIPRAEFCRLLRLLCADGLVTGAATSRESEW